MCEHEYVCGERALSSVQYHAEACGAKKTTKDSGLQEAEDCVDSIHAGAVLALSTKPSVVGPMDD